MDSWAQASAAAHEAVTTWNSTPVLSGIVVLGATLRLIALGAKSFWLDEIASVVIARMPGNSFWWWVWHDEGNMALYYVMLRPWLHIHQGEATVRLLSVLPGIASIPLMYALGRRLFGVGVGLLAALFLALSACSVVYSQEARGYSWLLLGVIASTYLFARLIAQPTLGTGCAYALAVGVMLYFHYFGLLVPLAHAASLAAVPGRSRPWKLVTAAASMIAVLSVPVLWMIHIQPIRHLDWVQKPSLLELYHLGVFLAAESGKGVGPVLLALELVLVVMFFRTMAEVWKKRGLKASNAAGDLTAGLRSNSTTKSSDVVVESSLPASLDAGLKASAAAGAHSKSATGIRNKEHGELWPYALVASGLLTPVVFSLAASVVRPIFFHRFLIICLPAWLLAVAVGASALRQRRMRVLAIAGVCLLSLTSTVISYTRVREDWRGVANYLIAHASSQDRVVYYRGVGNFAAESYRDWLPGGSSNRPTAVEVSSQADDWLAKLAGARRVWLVEYPANINDGTLRSVEAELHSRYTAVAGQSFRAVTVTEFVAKNAGQ